MFLLECMPSTLTDLLIQKVLLLSLQGLHVTYIFFFRYYNIARQRMERARQVLYLLEILSKCKRFIMERGWPSNYVPLTSTSPLTSESESFIVWICFSIAFVYVYSVLLCTDWLFNR